LAGVLSLVAARPALAYIDPNTGGMLFQILAVAFASLSAVLLIFSRQVRMLFARMRRAVRGLFGNEETESSDADPARIETRDAEMD
jgi:hypothetical protein